MHAYYRLFVFYEYWFFFASEKTLPCRLWTEPNRRLTLEVHNTRPVFLDWERGTSDRFWLYGYLTVIFILTSHRILTFSNWESLNSIVVGLNDSGGLGRCFKTLDDAREHFKFCWWGNLLFFSLYSWILQRSNWVVDRRNSVISLVEGLMTIQKWM